MEQPKDAIPRTAATGGGQKHATTAKAVEGKELDLKNIRIIYFTANSFTKKETPCTFYPTEMFFSNDGETDVTAINSVLTDDVQDNNKYDIVGRLIKGTPKGFYIQNGKKFFNK